MQRSKVEGDADVGLVQITPGFWIEPRFGDAAIGRNNIRAGETNGQRALRRRIKRERDVDLIGLHVENRVAESRFDIDKLGAPDGGDALGHFDRRALPRTGQRILLKIGGTIGNHGDAQLLGPGDSVEGAFGRGLGLGRANEERRRQCGGAGG
jgi:hypothetical protein